VGFERVDQKMRLMEAFSHPGVKAEPKVERSESHPLRHYRSSMFEARSSSELFLIGF